MKRPQLLPKGSLNRMLKAAEEAWMKRDFQQNIELLERAGKLAPADVGIQLQLGRMYGLRYNYAAAERCFEKAIRLAARKAEVLAAVGAQSRDFRNSELAEKYFRRALEEQGATSETFVRMAELYERARKMDEANALVERALKLNPACPMALLARTKFDAQSGKLEAAENLLRVFPATTNREAQIQKWYQLANVLDRQKRYDEAMTAFLQAKQLLQAEAGQYVVGLKTIHSRLQDISQNISASMVARWLDQSALVAPVRRLALLCGHPRSGTTLLEQVLDSHPDIISAEETEIFHDEAYVPLTAGHAEPRMVSILEGATPEGLRRSREQYFKAMELCLGQPLGNRLLVDKNPSLTILIPALIRVFPEIKILTALRDPRDVCLSCFMQPFLPLAQTSSAYLTLESTVDEYISVMNVWRTVAPLIKDHWIEVKYEDMVQDLESVSRRALNYLEVPWDNRVLQFNEHAQQKMVRSPTYSDVTKPVFTRAVGRWRNYEKYLAPHLAKLAPFVTAFDYET